MNFRFSLARAVQSLTPRFNRPKLRDMEMLVEDTVRGYEDALQGWDAPADVTDVESLNAMTDVLTERLNETTRVLSREFHRQKMPPGDLQRAVSRLRQAHDQRIHELLAENRAAIRDDLGTPAVGAWGWRQTPELRLQRSEIDVRQRLPYGEPIMEVLEALRSQRGGDEGAQIRALIEAWPWRPQAAYEATSREEVLNILFQHADTPLPGGDSANVTLQSTEEPLTDRESAEVARTSETTLDYALACLFLRLGPPPEPTALDYAPVSSGDGGAKQ